jgi:hypothetical protein
MSALAIYHYRGIKPCMGQNDRWRRGNYFLVIDHEYDETFEGVINDSDIQ